MILSGPRSTAVALLSFAGAFAVQQSAAPSVLTDPILVVITRGLSIILSLTFLVTLVKASMWFGADRKSRQLELAQRKQERERDAEQRKLDREAAALQRNEDREEAQRGRETLERILREIQSDLREHEDELGEHGERLAVIEDRDGDPRPRVRKRRGHGRREGDAP